MGTTLGNDHHDGPLTKCHDPRTPGRQAQARNAALAVVAASPWADVDLPADVCDQIGRLGFRGTGLHLAYLSIAAITAKHPITFDDLYERLAAHGWPTANTAKSNQRSQLDKLITKLQSAGALPSEWLTVGRQHRSPEDGRVEWAPILEMARAIVEQYETDVTLRQLFYRLVADGHIPNNRNAYGMLGKLTARARRDGTFPDLIDNTRHIERYRTFASPGTARRWLASIYRRDRTEGQDVSLYLAVEKRGLVQLMLNWFGDLGIPVLPLGGYASTPYCKQITEDIERQGRPAALLYAGDFDPSGEDILRDFTERVGVFDDVVPVALTPAQVEQYGLPEMPGKETDYRAAGFIAKHGRLVQVEVDALPPDTLRRLFQQAIDRYWDADAYDDVLQQEAEERHTLQRRGRNGR